MPPFSISNVRVRAVAAAVPAHEVRNDDLDLLNPQQGVGFVKAVGINTRRVASPRMCASDLCVAAARRIMEAASVRPAEIGVLVFVTQTPDYPLPGNSMLAQHRLGLPSSTFLLDVNQGCAGYVYGMASLASLMSAAKIGKGLLLVGDTITRLLSSRDRSTVPLFSDAGSATLLERVPEADTMHFNLGSDGQGAEVIYVRGGGARQPFGPDSLLMREEDQKVARASIHLSIRGMDVLHYTLKYVAPNILELLDFAQADVETPDYYVFHQANHILNQCLLRKLRIPDNKAPETLLDYGNTSCATIPVTLCRRLGKELAVGRKTLLLSGFGAGFSWGSALISGELILCPEPFEIPDPDGS
jgi:3-oxoacyl-[acyl-carrier-protein] synthase III